MRYRLFLAAGILCIGLPVSGQAYAADAQTAHQEEMNELGAENMEYMAQMIEAQRAAMEKGGNATTSSVIPPGYFPGGGSEDEVKKTYVYKGYSGKKGLEGVQLPQRLFNNIPDVR